MALMDLAQLLGNIGEFFGAIAVVATLGYLAVQVRQGKEATLENSRQMQSKAEADRTHQYNEINLAMAREPALQELMALLSSSDPELTPRQEQGARGLAFWFRNRYWADEVAHIQGQISDDSYRSGLNNARQLSHIYPGLAPFLEDAISEISQGREMTQMEQALVDRQPMSVR